MDEAPLIATTGSQMNQQTINLLQAEPQPMNPVAWSSMEALAVESRRMSANRIVTIGRSDPASLAFDMMRTKVLRSATQDKWGTLAITSPTAGCGKATIALNLAVSLAKQDELRVVLMDLDLRRPRIARILGHRPEFTTQDFLTSSCRLEEFFVRIGNNLAIGASPENVAHPAELLQDTRTAWALKRLRHSLGCDIVIYNLPPMLVSDDCIGFLPNVDVVMLVIAAEATTTAEIDVCERELTEQSKLLGVVLNKCRYKPEQYDNYQV